MKLGTVSVIVKKMVVLLILFVIGYYLLILVVIPIGSTLAFNLFPNRDKPNPIYGPLDSVEMVSKPILNSNPVYELNTKNGRLPINLPRVVPIYRLKTPQFSYEAGKRAQADAAIMGYSDLDLISDLKGEVYKWQSKSTGSYLEISLNNKELLSVTTLPGKESYFTPGSITNADAITTAKAFLQKVQRFEDTAYQAGTQTSHLGRFTPTGVLETKDPKEAQIARVDFFRFIGRNPATKKAFPVLGADAKKGLLSLFVRRSDNLNPTLNIPRAEIYFKEAETETQATYPLIPVQDAWNVVSAGRGVISNVTPREANPFNTYRAVRVDKILINDVSLAYYEANTFHKYLLPIYVFEGNYTSNNGSSGSITIYYPALTAEFTKPYSPEVTVTPTPQPEVSPTTTP